MVALRGWQWRPDRSQGVNRRVNRLAFLGGLPGTVANSQGQQVIDFYRNSCSWLFAVFANAGLSLLGSRGSCH